MNASGSASLATAWRIWCLGALFYLMAFFQRVAPAVMTDALMRDFNIGAALLGNLSALYFYSYVAMQIPTGILADRWGPRRLLATGALVAGTGTLLFALSSGIWLAGLGRLLIGGSVAVAFVGVLQLANNWFPPRHYSLAAGMTLLVGIIGAVCAGPPLRLLVVRFGWRSVILVSALATFAIGAAIWMWVRDCRLEKAADGSTETACRIDSAPWRSVGAGLLQVLKYRNTILLFVIPAGVVGPVLAFSGLWGVPYLTTHYGLSATRASALTTTLLVAWALAGPVFGWLSDRIRTRKRLYFTGLATALTGWLVICNTTGLPLPVLASVMVLTGFSSGCMILSFAFAKESVPSHLAGTVTGVVNMGVMTGPMLIQPGIGWLLDRHWDGVVDQGIRIYSLGAYQTGFTLITAWAVVSVVLLCFTRETRCRQIA
jgi:MFS family permease